MSANGHTDSDERRSGEGSRSRPRPKTVVILGAAYGGARAARMLAHSLPPDWRLVVIDRNSHMNHVYVFPRFSILPTHAPKAFIPYSKMLDPPDAPAEPSSSASTPTPTSKLPTPPLTPTSSVSSLSFSDQDHDDEEMPLREFIQGTVTALSSHSVSFVRPAPRRSSLMSSYGSSTTVGTYDFEGPEQVVEFDYCIYALGSGMPDPCNVWSEHPNLPPGIDNDEHLRGKGSKKCGVTWMEEKAKDRKEAKRILIVGGGALGIQFATDLKEIYPDKEVTLMHSRPQLMPIYPIEVHIAAIDTLQKLGVNVVLGERVMTWPEDPEHLNGKTKVLTTDKGREFHADLVLPCTGQKPHTSFIAALCPSSISPTTSRIRVHPTMQLLTHPPRPATSRANTTERLEALSLGPHPHPHLDSHLHLPTPPSSEDGQAQQDLGHIFAIGDCAETGAIQAGHTAYWQAEVAARNVCRMIEREEGRDKETLESYKPGAPCIKLTLGLTKAVTATGDEVVVSEDGVEDLKALLMWPMLAAGDCDPSE